MSGGGHHGIPGEAARRPRETATPGGSCFAVSARLWPAPYAGQIRCSRPVSPHPSWRLLPTDPRLVQRGECRHSGQPGAGRKLRATGVGSHSRRKCGAPPNALMRACSWSIGRLLSPRKNESGHGCGRPIGLPAIGCRQRVFFTLAKIAGNSRNLGDNYGRG